MATQWEWAKEGNAKYKWINGYLFTVGYGRKLTFGETKAWLRAQAAMYSYWSDAGYRSRSVPFHAEGFKFKGGYMDKPELKIRKETFNGKIEDLDEWIENLQGEVLNGVIEYLVKKEADQLKSSFNKVKS